MLSTPLLNMSIQRKMIISIIMALLSTLLLITFLIYIIPPKFILVSKNCASFKNHKTAQETYESNKVQYRKLDRDHDGIACEKLII